MTTENINQNAYGEIIIIDDDVSNLKYLSDILKQAGYQVRPVTDGEVAIRSISTRIPDLVLLDILMPGTDGIEVCKRLKKNPVTSELPIIFLSARDDTESKVMALEVGGADYVTKPFQPFEILARIKTHLTISRNIIERRQAEEDLRSREQLLNEIGSIAKIGGWEHDLITGEAIWTKATYQIVELESEGFIPGPEKHLVYYPAKDREILEKAYQLSIETGKQFDNELQATTAKGRPIWVRVVGCPEYKNGNCVKMKGTIQDISKYKIMEMQLQQAQKMESIGTLAGGIAHDFNNILFPIVGHTEMLLEDIPKDSPLKDSLNEIYTGALRARDLVQQILAFARHETNELKLMKMQPIIKEAMKMIRSTIPKTISITQHLNPDCGPVKADPTQIHQIVMNLATNAYHAMEKNGGELTISLKEIELDKDKLISPDMTPGSYACMTVADTGVGINKNIMDRIFDPFFTTKETGKGTGMGLSVVHGIVKRMNGEIQVYSEPDKGAEFIVYLPVAGSSSEKQEPKSDEPIPGKGEKILLVDDEQAIIVMEKQILSRLGYQVTSSTSSNEALATFNANPDHFDLVITDMSMPEMPGDKLAVELIKIRPDIPILLCTGYSESMTDDKIKSLGIKDFLMKPIVIKDLAQKIRDVLDGSRNACE